MKGAIGNALILNIVITFISIFLLLVVGSMSYTKAYKTKNYLLTELTEFVDENNEGAYGYVYHYNMSYYNWNLNQYTGSFYFDYHSFSNRVNPYLAKVGYPIVTKYRGCPYDGSYYGLAKDAWQGWYDYCIYYRVSADKNSTVNSRVRFKVLVYMKLDLPIVGNYIRIPITGETKEYVNF